MVIFDKEYFLSAIVLKYIHKVLQKGESLIDYVCEDLTRHRGNRFKGTAFEPAILLRAILCERLIAYCREQ